MSAERAKENATTLLNARNVLAEWRDLVAETDRETNHDEDELQAAIDAVEEAHQRVATLYPHLAMHAALLDVAERRGSDTGLDPEDDRSFL